LKPAASKLANASSAVIGFGANSEYKFEGRKSHSINGRPSARLKPASVYRSNFAAAAEISSASHSL